MEQETREALELFVEKAQELAGSKFVYHLRTRKLNLEINAAQDGPGRIESFLPDREDIKSLVLTVRMFVQNNDRISLHNMGVMSDPGLSQNWKGQVAGCRKTLNEGLHKPHPEGAADIAGKTATCWEVFQVFLYGELAHTEGKTREQYQAWRNTPIFPAIQFAFVDILTDVVEAVLYIAPLCEAELAGLPVPPLLAVDGQEGDEDAGAIS